MATAVNKKISTDSNSTIAFTLPIICQICLGKVKRPLICPNFHAFCGVCLETWLTRNRCCPACRIVIDDDHPCKSIIGGLTAADEYDSGVLHSDPQLRRARFEIFFKEYEDEFSKLQERVDSLLLENVSLKNESCSSKTHTKDEYTETGKVLLESKNLVVLTAKLEEATKLYNKVKHDMRSLKKENSDLKAENIDLTRENDCLKTEVASRSPYKYSRFTVATMQTKMNNYEKEISQLKKALERSDGVIEELERELYISKRCSATHAKVESKCENKFDSEDKNFNIETLPCNSHGSLLSDINYVVENNFKSSLRTNIIKNVNTADHDCVTNSSFPVKRNAGILVERSDDTPTKSPKKVKFNLSNNHNNETLSSSFEIPSPFTKPLSGDQHTSVARELHFDTLNPQSNLTSNIDSKIGFSSISTTLSITTVMDKHKG